MSASFISLNMMFDEQTIDAGKLKNVKGSYRSLPYVRNSMDQPWRPNITITPKQAQQYIEEQIPKITVDSIVSFGQGWDNITFLVNDHLVFRFAKTDETAKWLQQENNILLGLKGLLPLPIPDLVITGQPTSLNPYYFHAYEKLPGMPAYQIKISRADEAVITRQLAVFLKKLHSVSEDYYMKLGAKPLIYDRMDLKRRSDKLIEELHLVNRIHTLDIKAATECIERVQPIRPTLHTLVHGDLDFRHVLIKHNSISGIIDWGDVGVGHPVVDLAIVYLWVFPNFHKLFFDIYGNISYEMHQYAHFLALARSVTLIIYGHAIQDQHLLNASIKACHRLIETT